MLAFNRNPRSWLLISVALLAFLSGALSAAPPVQFELVMESGFPQTETQRWIQFLSRQDITQIRMRQAEVGDRDSITNRGTEERPSYFVIGVLTRRGRLLVPGGEFTLGDREPFQAWLARLEKDGLRNPDEASTSFGLSPEQLVAFHEKLAAPIGLETKGRRCGDVARDIVNKIPLTYSVSAAARQAFATGEICSDELQTLSAGTALAATLRPLGLVLRPEKVGKEVRLLICEVRETDEAWPVGWPSQETPGNTAPKLFESLQVDINNVSLEKALTAIQGRVGLPFLYDHNGIVRQRIDLAAVKVKYPAGRAMYRKVLDSLLYQGKLTSDLRVDESGQPFLWIAPR